jgi:hypothetical protein
MPLRTEVPQYAYSSLCSYSEYYPDHISPQHLADQWSKVVKQIGSSYEDRFKAVVLSNGNHKVESSEGQKELVHSVQRMLEEVIKDVRESEEQDHVPSSFDEVVELITTGKADSIPGVKKIPLKVSSGHNTFADVLLIPFISRCTVRSTKNHPANLKCSGQQSHGKRLLKQIFKNKCNSKKHKFLVIHLFSLLKHAGLCLQLGSVGSDKEHLVSTEIM